MSNNERKISILFNKSEDLEIEAKPLDHYRSQIEKKKQIHSESLYSQSKLKTERYQTIFIAMGFLFSLLGLIVHAKTSLSTVSLIIPGIESVKGLICALCGVLATGSWAMGLHLKSYKEAIHSADNRAHAALAKIYKTKRSDLGFYHMLNLGPKTQQEAVFQQNHRDAKEKLEERSSHSMELLSHIHQTDNLEPDEVEKLLNEALIELQMDLERIIVEFSQSLKP